MPPWPPAFSAPSKWSAWSEKISPKNTSRFIGNTESTLKGLQILQGKTFHWSGEYEVNMNNRRTLADRARACLKRSLPPCRRSYRNSDYVLLANIAPALQSHVLDQMKRPKFVVADTMDLWLNIALPDLVKLIKRVDGFVLNDSEAHQLTKCDNVLSALKAIHKHGPEVRDHQKRFARFHSLRPERLLHLPGLPVARSV